jgi:hypothetical protein
MSPRGAPSCASRSKNYWLTTPFRLTDLSEKRTFSGRGVTKHWHTRPGRKNPCKMNATTGGIRVGRGGLVLARLADYGCRPSAGSHFPGPRIPGRPIFVLHGANALFGRDFGAFFWVHWLKSGPPHRGKLRFRHRDTFARIGSAAKRCESQLWVMCGRRPRVKGFFWLSACGRVQVMCPACLCGAYDRWP